MKKVINLFLGSVIAINVAYAGDSCLDNGRNTALCYEMKHIRSLLNILESQPDLMQNNFGLIEKSSKDMTQVLNSILIRHASNPHISHVQNLRSQTLLLASEAQRESLEAHLTIGKLKTNCTACHAKSAPSSGHVWDEIAVGSWAVLNENCKVPGRNLYVCRSMYGMMMGINYYFAATKSSRKSFETSAEVAKEIYRIANDLESRRAVHFMDLPFSEIKAGALEVFSLAQNEDPKAFEKGLELRNTCMKCHGEK